MKAKVFGYRDVNMVDKETNKPIVGTSFFVGYPTEGVQGLETRKVFFSATRMRELGLRPVVDGFIQLEFGPNGKAYSAINLNDK